MKVVINKCFGGFGLSPLAVERLAELQGRKCFFFVNPREPRLDIHKLVAATRDQAEAEFMWYAYDVPDADRRNWSPDNWHELSMEERQKINADADGHSIESGRGIPRDDANLIRVVDELGERANGKHAKLSIIEIPDGTDYEIDEYDGAESVHETHRSWS